MRDDALRGASWYFTLDAHPAGSQPAVTVTVTVTVTNHGIRNTDWATKEATTGGDDVEIRSAEGELR